MKTLGNIIVSLFIIAAGYFCYVAIARAFATLL